MLTNIQYLLFGSSYNRIAAALLLLSKRFGEKTKKGVVININLIHQDIAYIAGVSRETASIAIKQLENKHIISRLKKKFVVEDMKKLTKEIFVAGDELGSPAAI